MNKLKQQIWQARMLAIAGLLFGAFVFGGMGLNLYKLTQLDFEAPYKAEVIRVVAIFPPIGIFVGWMDTGEENE